MYLKTYKRKTLTGCRGRGPQASNTKADFMTTDTFDDIFRRFLEVTGTSTQQELADVLGIKQSTISESKKRNTVPPGWYLTLFEKRGVNPDWLRQGKGPMLLRTEEGRYVEPGVPASPLMQGVSRPYYNSHELGGEEWTPSGCIVVPEPYAGRTIRILRMTGDGFAPTVRKGAFVGVDMQGVRPSSGDIFAVYMPLEGVVLKRLFCDGDTLVLRADHPQHPDMRLSREEAGRLVGKAVWVFQSM